MHISFPRIKNKSAKRALRKLVKDKNPNIVPLDDLTRGTASKGLPYRELNSLYGRPVLAGREDSHIEPTSTFLQVLEETEFIFPRLYKVCHLDMEHVQTPQLRFDDP